jgi:6-phosphogluconolactonase
MCSEERIFETVQGWDASYAQDQLEWFGPYNRKIGSGAPVRRWSGYGMNLAGLRWPVRWAAALAMGVAAQLLTGCNGFFVYPGTTTTTTGSTGSTNTGDYAYVSNVASGNQQIGVYSVSSSGLSSVGSFSVGYVPVAMKVAPSNGYLYVAAAAGNGSTSGLYVYTIGSTGALSGGTELASSVSIGAMDVSPDGNYLYTLDTSGTFLTQYVLNTSTGGYSTASTITVSGIPLQGCLAQGSPATQPCSIQVSPSGTYLGVSLGSTGQGNAQTLIYPYTSNGGLSATVGAVPAPSSTVGDYSLAFDKNDYLYIARTGELSSYAPPYVSTANPSNEYNFTSYGSGSIPRAVTLSPSYSYVYTADENSAGSISAFGLSGTAQIAQLSGSPVTGPAYVSALGVDNSGLYLLAEGYSASAGLQLFTITTTGLTAIGTNFATGTSLTVPNLIAMTH